MRMASRTSLWLVVVCIVALCVLAEAGRRGGRNKAWKKKNGDGCKYIRTTDVTDCDPLTNTRNITVTRKRGDATKCPETKVVSKPCKKVAGCKYSKEGALWGDCNLETGLKSIELTVMEGQNTKCPPKFVKSRPCNRAGKKKWGKKKGGRGGQGRRKNAAGRRAAKKAKRQQRRMNRASKVSDN